MSFLRKEMKSSSEILQVLKSSFPRHIDDINCRYLGLTTTRAKD